MCLLLTAFAAQCGPRYEWESTVVDDSRFASPSAASQPLQQGDGGGVPERSDPAASKVVLERSFRLRSRLNTHLLMLKFRR